MAEEKKPEENKQSFESSLAELESIVKRLEGGDLALEESLILYERGMKLSAECREQLEAAETRVELLSKKNGELKPF